MSTYISLLRSAVVADLSAIAEIVLYLFIKYIETKLFHYLSEKLESARFQGIKAHGLIRSSLQLPSKFPASPQSLSFPRNSGTSGITIHSWNVFDALIISRMKIWYMHPCYRNLKGETQLPRVD